MRRFLLQSRNRQFFLFDLFLLAVLPTLALGLRMDGFEALSRFSSGLTIYTLLGLLVRPLVFVLMGLYRRYWRYASIDEVSLIGSTVALATLLHAALIYAWNLLPVCGELIFFPCRPTPFLPRSLPLIDGLLTLLAVAGTRLSVRLMENSRWSDQRKGKRVLIIGAGDAGLMTAREISHNPHLGMMLVGFVDDDPAKQGMRIQGLKVLGGRERIAEIVQQQRVHEAIIAMPTEPGRTIRIMRDLCEQAGIRAKTIPAMYELLSGRVSVNQIRDVQIEDLLRRDAVRMESPAVSGMLRGKRILVTGAGGSIGLEICRQVLHHQAGEVVMLGHGENSIFRGLRDLRAGQPEPRLKALIADIRDQPRMRQIFAQHRPEIVFHAAAHKHVHLMEENLQDAISNNVLGTRVLLQAAAEFAVERFVLVSSDKAVNPSSVMGVTKRIGELMVIEAARMVGGQAKPRPTHLAVRFGNVLGSRGSVINLFKEEIQRGGPLVITHPDMRRYFMTGPEAVQLVLSAATIGDGGDIFVLDMGEPIRILDLARDLIELSGLEVGKDIEIQFSGPFPGEKLHEELFSDAEQYLPSKQDKCFILQQGKRLPPVNFEADVEALIDAAENADFETIEQRLKTLVPEFERRPVSKSGA